MTGVMKMDGAYGAPLSLSTLQGIRCDLYVYGKLLMKIMVYYLTFLVSHYRFSLSLAVGRLPNTEFTL